MRSYGCSTLVLRGRINQQNPTGTQKTNANVGGIGKSITEAIATGGTNNTTVNISLGGKYLILHHKL